MPKESQHPGEAELLKYLKPVSPQDEFNYCCTCCADCCKGIKASVALETLDIFNISRYLKQFGNPVWRMEEILAKYTTLMPITDFGYPMFFAETAGPDDACVFLKSGKCSLQGLDLKRSPKPRTCRMYPLTAEPADNDEGFNYYKITERNHHFAGPRICVGDWMAENLTSEDREFTKTDIPATLQIGRLMRQKQAAGIDFSRVFCAILFHKYINFDTDKPFMLQYVRNISTLIHVLKNMK